MASPTSVDLLAPLHRLSLEEYLRVAGTGVFDGGPRVELIDGVVVEMSPAGKPHRLAVMWLTRALVTQLDDAHIVSPQQGIQLPRLRSMPEPDLAVLEIDELRQASDEPLLVVEVSDSSLRYDRLTKARLYARHGVPDYWIFNVTDRVVEVLREPAGDAFSSREVHGAGAALTPLRLPRVSVVLDELVAFVGTDG